MNHEMMVSTPAMTDALAKLLSCALNFASVIILFTDQRRAANRPATVLGADYSAEVAAVIAKIRQAGVSVEPYLSRENSVTNLWRKIPRLHWERTTSSLK
jgi:hypothetical protein